MNKTFLYCLGILAFWFLVIRNIKPSRKTESDNTSDSKNYSIKGPGFSNGQSIK